MPFMKPDDNQKMLFSFLQYISPTWYFNLPSKGNLPYFLDFDLLPETDKALLELDLAYSSHAVAKLDVAYQAWHKGFIESEPAKALNRADIAPTIDDNYRFIRRYFHPVWSWYILLLRLFTLHNPLRECSAFIRHRRVLRVALYAQVYPHETSYQDFDSELVKSAPKVTVIIPTLNRYSYLKDVLHDFEQQDYKNFEIVIIDQSEPFQADFYVSFELDFKLIRQEEKALWLARNTGIKNSENDYIALSEDDVRVPSDWVYQHLKCLDYFKADVSCGVFFPEGSVIPVGRSFLKYADQFATGNACIKKSVFKETGLFDRQFEKQRMGDGEFGLRTYLAGFKMVSNPYAFCEDVKAPSGGLRQMGSWDAFRPKSLFAPRPVPSVLYFYRKYFGSQLAVLALVKNVAPSIIPYRFKRNRYMLVIGSFLALLVFPLLIIQVCRAWRKSSQKLQEGALIEFLQ